MHVKELHRLAKMANTDAKVSIRMTDEDVTVRWYAMHNHPGSFSRVLPWTALEEDRGPDYLAVKEYLRMAAFYMEGFGGRHDRTSELFTNKPSLLEGRHSGLLPNNALRSPRPDTSPMRLPVLHLRSADLLPGDVVRTTRGHWPSKTVVRLEEVDNGYLVHWKTGGSTRYGFDHVHDVVRGARYYQRDRGQHG